MIARDPHVVRRDASMVSLGYFNSTIQMMQTVSPLDGAIAFITPPRLALLRKPRTAGFVSSSLLST
jgi:hypothetical protein